MYYSIKCVLSCLTDWLVSELPEKKLLRFEQKHVQ
jgi:hypothetical protein